jgi:hypothetical protein
MDRQAARIRHLRSLRKQQDFAEDQIDKHIQRAEDLGDIHHVDADKAAKIENDAMKMERLIHGEPSEINENRNTDIDWSRLDAAEIKVFKALVIKLKGGEGE